MADTKILFEQRVSLPPGVTVSYSDRCLRVTGALGTIERKLFHPRISLRCEGSLIIVAPVAQHVKKSDKTLIGTFVAHLKNCVAGVQEEFDCHVKICSGHFPMTVSIEGSEILVKNFLGEKVARRSSIMSGVKAQVSGETIIFSGIDKEKVGQSAANLELATHVRHRDRRVFQDGCYIVSKAVQRSRL